MLSNKPSRLYRGKRESALAQEAGAVTVFLEINMAEVEQRIAASGHLSDEERLAKLFNIPVEVFKPGVDIYTAIAAHIVEIEPSEVTKIQRNYVKARLMEWFYVN